MLCDCGSGIAFASCCAMIWQQEGATDSAERLMRARYTAYARGNIEFIRLTTLPIQQPCLDIAQMTSWSTQTDWLGLQVLSHQLAAHSAQHAWVVFSVNCLENGQPYTHHERSAFVKDAVSWRFIDPTVPIKAERNQPCICGSRQKFKRCCAPMLG